MVDLTPAYDNDYNNPYYSGSAIADSTVVPGTFQVAVNGHPYMLNTDPAAIEVYGVRFKEASLPLLREQSDAGKLPGEQSLSPAQFWRRSQDSWHSGGGQSMLDRDNSTLTRFNASKGINPWTRYQLTLLGGTANARASANTNLVGVAANSRFYVADGSTLASTSDLSAFTATTGTPAAAATSLATNGYQVFAAYGASGVYQVTATAGTAYVTGTVSLVGYAKGRLFCASGGAIYSPTAPPALGTALMTKSDTNWAWTCIAEGDTCVYAAGAAGDKSIIYRFALVTDATAMSAGTAAGTLPTGEVVQSMLGYLGFLVIGTNKGVRFATASSTGDLTLGALIPTPGAVYCLDATDRFVWFGWTNYDTTSSGLGRFDLSVINDGLAPAYATDLMATGQGTVRATGLVGTRRLFTVDGLGTFAEATTPVSSGTFTSGQINYGISDAKVPVYVDLKHSVLTTGTSVAVAMASDRGTATSLGSSATVGTVSPSELISTGARRAEEMELTFTLTSSAGVGPTLTRWTLLSYPAPAGASTYTLPLLLFPRLNTVTDSAYHLDPFTEYQFLRDLHDSREIITVQVGEDTFEGTMEEFIWIPEELGPDQNFWAGTFVAVIRRIKG